MQLTVFFNNTKAKQVINMSDKFALGFDGKSKMSNYELEVKAIELAIYLGGGNYMNHSFHNSNI